MAARCLALLFFLMAFEPAKLPGAWSPWVPPDSPWLQWSGRLLFSGGAAHFDWSGVAVRAAFEGGSLLAYIEPRDNNFNVFIDGKLHAIVGPKPKSGSIPGYALWASPAEGGDGKAWAFSDLGPGPHRLEITKRTSANFGEAAFRGLRIAAGAKMLSVPPLPARRLEFLGDSLTNAYGCEGPGKACTELRPYENGWKSWAARASRELNADFQVLALSGFGVVRNYGDKEKSSTNPFPVYYPRTLQNREAPLYDRARFKPDAVVIMLGTNDHSTEPYPDAHDFIAGYLALINSALDGRHCPVILGSPSGRKVHEERVRAVLAQAKASGIDADLVVLEDAADAEMGCDWHPMEGVHERWAKVLVSKLKAKLSW